MVYGTSVPPLVQPRFLPPEWFVTPSFSPPVELPQHERSMASSLLCAEDVHLRAARRSTQRSTHTCHVYRPARWRMAWHSHVARSRERTGWRMLPSVASNARATCCHVSIARCVDTHYIPTATSLPGVNNTLGLGVTKTQNVWRSTRGT